MTDFTALLQGGNAWLFLPTAILLGALHGLEPGHSKTMMAAFIVAVRGTVGQAALLGLAAAISHSAVVWAVAMAGLYFGEHWNAEATEPYFQLLSGALMAVVALWMLWRTARPHEHRDDDRHDHDHDHDHDHVEDYHHGDAHARAHARDIDTRFAGRSVTNAQIIVFGLTGGLIPCPASITVLLLCLQLKRVALGATLVMGFSVGLALTLVASGVLAALSLRHMQGRWSGFGDWARRAPYVSGVLILLLGGYVAWQGGRALVAG